MQQLNRGRSFDIVWAMDELIVPQECWSNSVKALRTRRLQLQRARYVEGWAVVTIGGHSIAIEHGWIELEDGSIADPTIVNNEDDEVTQTIEYFPGVRYTLAELKGVRLRSLPRVWHTHGWGGFQNEDYKDAYNTAQRRAR